MLRYVESKVVWVWFFSPSCRPPFYLVVKKSEVTSKSSFKSAENRAASSLGVGGHPLRGDFGRVKTLIGLERFAVDKSRAFYLDFPEIPEITEILEFLEILEMGFTKEWNHGNPRKPGNGVKWGVVCIDQCFDILIVKKGEVPQKSFLFGWKSLSKKPMARQSSLHEDFVRVQTHMGSEPFEVGKIVPRT